MKNQESILGELETLIETFYKLEKQKNIEPGKRKIQVGTPYYDHQETNRVLKTLLSGWITQGPQVKEFENKYAEYCGSKFGVAVNSGSSANLLVLATLMDKRFGKTRLKRGDEVIVPAATFPTTATPLIQLGLVPVFSDVDIESYTLSPEEVEKNITKKTKAIFPVHFFGHPAEMDPINEIAEKHDLFVIEDSCEAHGAKYKNKKVGSLGDVATFSFHVAHNMTTGEGGMIVTDDYHIADLSRILRQFGRACFCDHCNKKREETLNEEMKEYDPRYLFEYLGYSTKMVDMQAAFGLVQLSKLDNMTEMRRDIVRQFRKYLEPYSDTIRPQAEKEWAYHSYYSFPMLITDEAKFTRRKLVDFLESRNIETRGLMGGSLAHQPAFIGKKFKTGNLVNTVKIRDNGFFIGCHPDITREEVKYVGDTFTEFLEQHR